MDPGGVIGIVGVSFCVCDLAIKTMLHKTFVDVREEETAVKERVVFFSSSEVHKTNAVLYTSKHENLRKKGFNWSLLGSIYVPSSHILYSSLLLNNIY